MPKKKESWKATRTERYTVGPFDRTLVAGETYDDLPEELVTSLSGDAGGLVPADEGEEEAADA